MRFGVQKDTAHTTHAMRVLNSFQETRHHVSLLHATSSHLEVFEVRFPQVAVHRFGRRALPLVAAHVVHQVFGFAEHFGLGQVALSPVVPLAGGAMQGEEGQTATETPLEESRTGK